MKPLKCECVDPGCRMHLGRSRCVNNVFMVVFRTDTEDREGTPMCEPCSEDALESGVFACE